MLIPLFNAILIGLITFLSYKYFSLRERLGSEGHRSIGYAETFGRFADKAEGYDNGHSQKIADLAVKIGAEKGLSEHRLEGLRFAAILHDIGEILLPKEILKSKKDLSSEERFLLRTHPLLGEFELKRYCKAFDEVPTIVRWHHERWDGSGYPDGLKGTEIPLCARILALADAVSAMGESRPYRSNEMKMPEIVKELERLAGLQFDPELVEIFIKLFAKPEEKGAER